MTASAVPLLELFGTRTDNCIRAAVALEDAGLAYSARKVDLPWGKHRSEGFLALDPTGKVPVLVARHETSTPLLPSRSIAAMTFAMFNEQHIDWNTLPSPRKWFEAPATRLTVQRGIRAFT